MSRTVLRFGVGILGLTALASPCAAECRAPQRLAVGWSGPASVGTAPATVTWNQFTVVTNATGNSNQITGSTGPITVTQTSGPIFVSSGGAPGSAGSGGQGTPGTPPTDFGGIGVLGGRSSGIGPIGLGSVGVGSVGTGSVGVGSVGVGSGGTGGSVTVNAPVTVPKNGGYGSAVASSLLQAVTGSVAGLGVAAQPTVGVGVATGAGIVSGVSGAPTAAPGGAAASTVTSPIQVCATCLTGGVGG